MCGSPPSSPAGRSTSVRSVDTRKKTRRGKPRPKNLLRNRRSPPPTPNPSSRAAPRRRLSPPPKRKPTKKRSWRKRRRRIKGKLRIGKPSRRLRLREGLCYHLPVLDVTHHL